MTPLTFSIAGAIASVLLVLVVLELIRKRRLKERYALLWLVARRWPVERRFLMALPVELAWELAENTPMVIDRYREATIALGYNGDSVINSVSDIGMMAAGFLAARRLPAWVSLLAVATLELVPLLVIRDNLTLNVWMLVAPNDAVRSWQSA